LANEQGILKLHIHCVAYLIPQSQILSSKNRERSLVKFARKGVDFQHLNLVVILLQKEIYDLVGAITAMLTHEL